MLQRAPHHCLVKVHSTWKTTFGSNSLSHQWNSAGLSPSPSEVTERRVLWAEGVVGRNCAHCQANNKAINLILPTFSGVLLPTHVLVSFAHHHCLWCKSCKAGTLLMSGSIQCLSQNRSGGEEDRGAAEGSDGMSAILILWQQQDQLCRSFTSDTWLHNSHFSPLSKFTSSQRQFAHALQLHHVKYQLHNEVQVWHLFWTECSSSPATSPFSSCSLLSSMVLVDPLWLQPEIQQKSFPIPVCEELSHS